MSIEEPVKQYFTYKPPGVSWLGDVPEHWEVRRIKALYREVDERSTTGSEELMSVSHKTGVTPRKQNVTMFLAESNVGYKVCRPGDIVVNTMWAYMAALGVARQEGLVSPSYGVYRPIHHDALNDDYVDSLLRTEAYRSAYLSRSTGITASRLRLYPESFLGIPLLYPPFPEQRAIVRYLDYMDRRIRRYVNAKRKLIALLEEERKISTIEAMRSPNTMIRRLEVVADLVQRPIKRASDETYTPIGLYNRGRGMFRKEPRCGNDLGDSNFFWIEEGDLVISGQFAWEGAVALASDIEHGCVASHRYPILRGKPGILDSGFLLGFFQTDWGQLLLDHNSRGAAGRNRPLNARALMKEKISLPPIETQLRVAGMLQLESYVRQRARLSEQLLSEYRTRLIADVVTGKLDVRKAASQLPDEAGDRDQIEESGPLADGLDEDLFDADNSVDELATEREVTA